MRNAYQLQKIEADRQSTKEKKRNRDDSSFLLFITADNYKPRRGKKNKSEIWHLKAVLSTSQMMRSFLRQEMNQQLHCIQVCRLFSDVCYSNVFFYLFTACVLFVVVVSSVQVQLHQRWRSELNSMGNIRYQWVDQTTFRANQSGWTDYCCGIYAWIAAESQLCAVIVLALCFSCFEENAWRESGYPHFSSRVITRDMKCSEEKAISLLHQKSVRYSAR